MNYPVSKSTKRRRFLEEIEFIGDIVDQQTSSFRDQRGVQLENIQTTDIEYIGINCTSNKAEDINKLPFVSFFDSNITSINESELQLISDSDTDDDNTSIQFPFFNDDKKQILNSLSQWAVTNNITNIALSSLLKCLKSHKCFNNFPSDARTILKSNSNN
jgi:hypothetical protein|uniref:Uncharacterized protein n=1 Tax=Sipha flava TaxID=143950 RepID=A0A2S2QQD0_9HEMI